MSDKFLPYEIDRTGNKRLPWSMRTALAVTAVCLLVLVTPGTAPGAEIFTVKHDTGSGGGGSTNYGQSFTANVPGIGVPLAGNPDNVYLYSMGIRAGGSGNGSGFRYLNIEILSIVVDGGRSMFSRGDVLEAVYEARSMYHVR